LLTYPPRVRTFLQALMPKDEAIKEAYRAALGRRGALDTGAGGMYSYFILPILVLLAISAIVFFIRARATSRHAAQFRGRVGRQVPPPSAAESSDLPLFAQLGRGTDPQMFEYIEHLRTLDLPHPVKLKKIKRAYRNAVKGLHPDTNKNLSESDSQKFIKLTYIYKQILKLRKELGLKDEG